MTKKSFPAVVLCLVISLAAASACRTGEISIQRGTVKEIRDLGRSHDYVLTLPDGGEALLKWPGVQLEPGLEVAFFVRRGAKEGGMTTFMRIPAKKGPMPFSEGFSRFCLAGQGIEDDWVIFSRSGKVIGRYVYAGMNQFREGLASARNPGGDWGFIDQTGTMKIEPRFGVGYDNHKFFFNEGRAGVFIYSGSVKFYADTSGQPVFGLPSNDWHVVTPYSEGLAVIGCKFGPERGSLYIVDKQGVRQNQAPVMTPDDGIGLYGFCALPFSEGLAGFRDAGGRWGFMNGTGEAVIHPEYDRVRPFREGLAAVRTSDGKWGYIDTDGEWAVNPVYDATERFSEGLAAVQQGGHWGYINRDGELVIKMTLAKAGHFYEGAAPVSAAPEGRRNALWGLLGKNGEYILPPQYGWITTEEGYEQMANKFELPAFSDGLVLFSNSFQRNTRYAWVNPKGEEELFVIID